MKTITLKQENIITTNHGFFQGWGSSLCWWANRVGYSPVLTRQAASLFYSQSGLALNIMRYNIGGGDDPSHDHIQRTDSAIPGWTKWDPEKNAYIYDKSTDENQLNVLTKCYEEAGENAFVEAFSNSAPYYMTESGCTSGSLNPADNNLREDCYDSFALYLATVCHLLETEFGIPVSSIAAMNEPNTSFWIAGSPKQEGCHFDPGCSQSRLLTATEKAFRRLNLLHTEITASDETSTDKQLLACELYSSDAWKIIQRISTHTYEVSKRKELGQFAQKKNINLWMSEVDGPFFLGEQAGEMGAALGFAQKILDDINELSPSAWVMWQLIDSHISRHGYQGRKDFGMPDTQKGYWGVAVADHDKQEILLTKKYYAFGQFTRYIRPGSKLIRCNRHALASFDPEEKSITVVAVNADPQEKELQIDLSAFAPCKKATVIRTSGSLQNGENWKLYQTLPMNDGMLHAVLKGYSITTFICNC